MTLTTNPETTTMTRRPSPALHPAATALPSETTPPMGSAAPCAPADLPLPSTRQKSRPRPAPSPFNLADCNGFVDNSGDGFNNNCNDDAPVTGLVTLAPDGSVLGGDPAVVELLRRCELPRVMRAPMPRGFGKLRAFMAVFLAAGEASR